MMKRLAILAIVCCSLVLTSCFRPQEKYVAAITEWHFANSENQIGAKAVLGTIHSLWEGEYAYKGLSTDICNIKARTRYAESEAAILLHSSELEPYFEQGDYFVYTLTRITDGNEMLVQLKFRVDADGSFGTEDLYDFYEEDEN